MESALIEKISEQGVLVTFMLLAIIVLLMAVRILYNRNVQQGLENVKALVDSTTAINNNTAALGMLIKQIERLEDV